MIRDKRTYVHIPPGFGELCLAVFNGGSNLLFLDWCSAIVPSGEVRLCGRDCKSDVQIRPIPKEIV